MLISFERVYFKKTSDFYFWDMKIATEFLNEYLDERGMDREMFDNISEMDELKKDEIVFR
jgi:hypothetical protein